MEVIIVSGLWENSHSELIMVINLNRPVLTWNVYAGLCPELNLSTVVLGKFPCTLTVDAILLSLHFYNPALACWTSAWLCPLLYCSLCSESCPLAFPMWTAPGLWSFRSFILPSLLGRITSCLGCEMEMNHPLTEMEMPGHLHGKVSKPLLSILPTTQRFRVHCFSHSTLLEAAPGAVTAA